MKTLEVFETGILTLFADHDLEAEVNIEREASLRCWEAYVTWRNAGEKLAALRWPADWWQSTKDRWFTLWLKRRFPVKYSFIDIKVIYPRLALPDQESFLLVDAPEAWKEYEGENDDVGA